MESKVFQESAIEKLNEYSDALTSLISLSENYLQVQNELKSLLEVKRTLSLKHRSRPARFSLPRQNTLEDNIPDEVRCPTCLEIFTEEVFQCVNGHSICSACCSTLRECPTCRQKFGSGKIRNLAVECMMKNLTMDCVYKEAGCTSKVAYSEMQNHFESCPAKPVRHSEYKKVRQKIRDLEANRKRLEQQLDEANKHVMKTKTIWLNTYDEDNPSLLSQPSEIQLKEKETVMTQLYKKLLKVLES